MRFWFKIPIRQVRGIRTTPHPESLVQTQLQADKDYRRSSKHFNSLTSNTFETTNSFLYEKDIVFGGRQVSHLSTGSTRQEAKVKKSSDVDVLDFPQLLDVLPKEVIKDANKIMAFPLLNPWRTSTIAADALTESEDVAQKKRAAILNSKFPSSNFPSVTRVLQATMDESSKEVLQKWKQRMTEEMGEVPFIQHQRKLFHRGSLLHRSIAQQLKDPELTIQVPEEISGFWNSLSEVLPEISSVKFMEKRITHPYLCYSGVADCAAVMNGELILVDWKTSSRPKPELINLYDEPIQAVSYAGALNYDAKTDFQVEKVAVVIAYEDGSPADVHQLSHSHCRDYWKMWLQRLHKYWLLLEQNKIKGGK